MEQGELERRLWDAANCLRGPVDPSDFKAYVFPLLFLKRISDTWAAEHARAMADYDDETLAALPENYRFQVPKGCHWPDLRRASENVGVRLQTILDRIQQANPDALAGIFGTVAWGDTERLPEHALVNLINVFDSIDLSPDAVGNDLLGAGYEYLLREFADASGKKAGEFFTPRSVVRLLTRILEPKAGESIYDPAVGSAGMLVEALNEVRESGEDTRTLRLYGQEANLTTAAIARMNLYLHDIEDFRIMRGDTLREPKFQDSKGQLTRFSVVLANPPFSLKNWGQESWATDPYGRAFCGVPSAGVGDYAWIQHMVKSMEAGTGRVGVVMPHGVLFRGGQEAAIRQCLIESDQLEAVIGLPPNLFYSTSIPACLLIFRATKAPERRSKVLFVDGATRFTKGKNQNSLTDDDVAAILGGYFSAETDDSGTVNARLVEHAEIEANRWDLNVGWYVETAAAAGLDLAGALATYSKARDARLDAEKAMFSILRSAGIADLGTFDD